MPYFNTYGGANAAVAAGTAVLDALADGRLMAGAADTGRCDAGDAERFPEQLLLAHCCQRTVASTLLPEQLMLAPCCQHCCWHTAQV
jgi:hypothetical protein